MYISLEKALKYKTSGFRLAVTFHSLAFLDLHTDINVKLDNVDEFVRDDHAGFILKIYPRDTSNINGSIFKN